VVRRLVVLLSIIAACLAGAPAHAAPPDNDDRANATLVEIDPVWRSDSVPLLSGTVEASEDLSCLRTTTGDVERDDLYASLWFRIELGASSTLAARVWGDLTQPSIGIYKASDATPFACQDDGGRLRVNVDAGQTYLLQIACECVASTSATNLELGWVPSNDDRAKAAPIEVPIVRQWLFSKGATRQPGDPDGCSDPTVNVPVWPLAVEHPTVWYSLKPTRDSIWLATTWRALGGTNIHLFDVSGDGTRRVSCTPTDDGWYTYARLDLVGGHDYLLAIVDLSTEPTILELSVDEMERRDVSVSGLRVDAREEPISFKRTISFDYELVDGTSRYSRYEVSTCPREGASQLCRTISSGMFYAKSSGTIEVSWTTVACVGDYTVRVHVFDPRTADVTPQDDTAEIPVSFLGGGYQVGATC
jgi:hypothetical protein